MTRPANHRHKIFLLAALVLATLPLFTHAATPVFDNPLPNVTNIRSLIMSLTKWLVGLSALITLLALVIGGMRLIIGGFNNEQEAVAARKIITWAIIGFVVVGLAAAILVAVARVVGI